MNQIQKCIWLIEAIKGGEITHKELSARWSRDKNLSDGKELSRSTFNRWRDILRDQFGIEIGCNRSAGYTYYIVNPEAIDEDRLRKWMLDSFAVGNLIGDNLSLKNRILVDDIPSGREHLVIFMEAMKTNRAVEITYRSFVSAESRTFTIEPYCVKLYDNRWYVLGRSENSGKLLIYALDRILSASVSDRIFKLPKDFSAADYFGNYYGIYTAPADKKPQRIVLRTYDEHGEYLKTLPLHWSQVIIKETDDYIEFSLYLVPTSDFVMRLLQMGSLVEVMKPQSLRDEMKKWTGEMYDYYKDDK